MEVETSKVCLVDGVGRPFVIEIAKQHVSPNVIRWPHPQKGEGEAQVLVHFDRSNNEYDPYGRQVYRMRGSGNPEIRGIYLVKQAAA